MVMKLKQMLFLLLTEKTVDISEISDMITFKEFTVIQTSNMYDPNAESKLSDTEEIKVKIAEHGSKHIFTSDGVEIDQSLKWLGEYPLTNCYMAMHTPAKAVTDHAVFDYNFIPFEITPAKYGKYSNVDKAIVYGESSGVKTEFSVKKYPTGLTGGDLFNITDNNGNAYNKCYFIVCSSGNTTADMLWKSETFYKYDVCETL